MNRAYLPLLLLPLVAWAACAADTTMSLASFDTSCAQDQDCALVHAGSACDARCPNAAINQSGLATYQQEYEAKRASCSGPVASLCGPSSAVCKQGQCAFTTP